MQTLVSYAPGTSAQGLEAWPALAAIICDKFETRGPQGYEPKGKNRGDCAAGICSKQHRPFVARMRTVSFPLCSRSRLSSTHRQPATGRNFEAFLLIKRGLLVRFEKRPPRCSRRPALRILGLAGSAVIPCHLALQQEAAREKMAVWQQISHASCWRINDDGIAEGSRRLLPFWRPTSVRRFRG